MHFSVNLIFHRLCCHARRYAIYIAEIEIGVLINCLKVWVKIIFILLFIFHQLIFCKTLKCCLKIFTSVSLMTQQLLFCLWLNKNTHICLLIYIFSQVSNKKENMKALRIKKKIWNLLQTDTLSVLWWLNIWEHQVESQGLYSQIICISCLHILNMFNKIAIPHKFRRQRLLLDQLS